MTEAIKYGEPLPHEEQKLIELDDELKKNNITLPYFMPERNSEIHRRIILHKFLLARKWNVAQALEMIKVAQEFRVEKGLDAKPLFPSPNGLLVGYDEEWMAKSATARAPREKSELDIYAAAMATSYSGCYYKWDRANRPVWIERTGMINSVKLVETLQRCVKPGQDYKTPAVEVHLYTNELWAELIEHQRFRSGDPTICQSLIIMDCQGLGVSQVHRPALAVLQAISQMDQKYYPEGMYKLYITNAGRAVSMALAFIKQWLDVRVQQKIVVLKPEEIGKLQEDISLENIPEFLGGTSKEPVPLPTGELVTDQATTEKVQVPAGQFSQKYITMSKGQITTWDFTTEGQRTIGYSVTFGSKTVVEYVKYENLKETVSGAYTAEEDGVLGLKFDNSFSWVSSKCVMLRLESGSIPMPVSPKSGQATVEPPSS